MKILFPFNPVDFTKIFQRTYNNYINGQLFVRINIKNLIFIGLLFTQLNLRSFFSARTYILFTQRPQRFFFFFACSAFSLRALREPIFFTQRAQRFISRKERKVFFFSASSAYFFAFSARTRFLYYFNF